MQLSFVCSRCEKPAQVEVPSHDSSVECPHCRQAITQPEGAWEDGRLTRCLVCPSTDLFQRKDFPQRLGVAIVVLGFGISCITWFYYWTTLTFVVLFITALADFLLYLVVGDSLVCYRCGATYRQLPLDSPHEAFDLETHERYRQQKARLAAVASPAQPTKELSVQDPRAAVPVNGPAVLDN